MNREQQPSPPACYEEEAEEAVGTAHPLLADLIVDYKRVLNRKTGEVTDIRVSDGLVLNRRAADARLMKKFLTANRKKRKKRGGRR